MSDRGDSITIARQYMDSLLVESRIMGSGMPSTRFELLGETFETPIMTAALSHLDLVGMAEGARQAGAAVCIGMGDNDELCRVLETGAKVIKVIKPYADPEEIYRRMQCAREHGAMAVGMDFEHAINVNDAEDSVVAGLPMRAMPLEEIRDIVHMAGLPFFAKGILSARDARICREIGCAGVILSHHNGLMRYAVPPVMVLPEIRKAVGLDMKIIVDGGIETGFDAYKALALGADAVSVGRVLMDPLKNQGAEGVRDTIRAMTGQLQAMMRRTAVEDLEHMDPTVIHRM